MISSTTVFYSLLGGILPALFWLAFWLREDSKRPEPRGLLIRTFIFGMLAVVLVLPFQKVADFFFPGTVFVAVLLWALFEELFKFIAAYKGGLHTPDDDEPVDNIIYLITAALGFTAFENALFIAGPLLQADVLGAIFTGNIRFIGASMLHVVSSAVVGIALALSFYKPRAWKFFWGAVGLVIGIAIHAGFNLALMHGETLGTPLAFGFVWVGVAVLLLFFERVKSIRRK